MGGHPSDSSWDENMPSPMLRLTCSNLQAAGALMGPMYSPMTTPQHPMNEPRIQEGFRRSSWAQADPNRS